VIALIGSALQSFDKTFVVPGWAILAVGTLLLFIAACQIESELIQEKAKNRKPLPDMPLEAAVKRICGKEDVFGPDDNPTEVLQALKSLAERAAAGAITIFGVKGIQYLPSGPRETVDAVVKRPPIDAKFWETNSIQYLSFYKDRIGVTENDIGTKDVGTGYGYLWLDTKQIDALWPAPRKRINWRHPIQFRESI
jgi:hypothetical protein